MKEKPQIRGGESKYYARRIDGWRGVQLHAMHILVRQNQPRIDQIKAIGEEAWAALLRKKQYEEVVLAGDLQILIPAVCAQITQELLDEIGYVGIKEAAVWLCIEMQAQSFELLSALLLEQAEAEPEVYLVSVTKTN